MIIAKLDTLYSDPYETKREVNPLVPGCIGNLNQFGKILMKRNELVS